MNVLMAVAEFEREITRERVNAGLAVARPGGEAGRRATITTQPTKWGSQSSWMGVAQWRELEWRVRLSGSCSGRSR